MYFVIIVISDIRASYRQTVSIFYVYVACAMLFSMIIKKLF